MKECCQKTLEDEWKNIRHWRPTLHWCPEWDYLLIEKGDPEFEACLCFRNKPGKTESGENK